MRGVWRICFFLCFTKRRGGNLAVWLVSAAGPHSRYRKLLGETVHHYVAAVVGRFLKSAFGNDVTSHCNVIPISLLPQKCSWAAGWNDGKAFYFYLFFCFDKRKKKKPFSALYVNVKTPPKWYNQWHNRSLNVWGEWGTLRLNTIIFPFSCF